MSLLLSPLDSKTKVFSSMLFLLNCSVLFISFGQPCQTPLSMGFPRQEYWSGLPFPSPGALSDPGIEPASPDWQVDSLPLSHLGNPFSNIPCNVSKTYPRNMTLGRLQTPCDRHFLKAADPQFWLGQNVLNYSTIYPRSFPARGGWIYHSSSPICYK